MKTNPKESKLSNVAEIDFGFREALVVCLEYGESQGFLIADSFSQEEKNSTLILNDATYLYGDGQTLGSVSSERTILSCASDMWVATDVATVPAFPYPSRTPYPVLNISRHGFSWLISRLEDRHYQRVWFHLWSRFEKCSAPDRASSEDSSIPIYSPPKLVG